MQPEMFCLTSGLLDVPGNCLHVMAGAACLGLQMFVNQPSGPNFSVRADSGADGQGGPPGAGIEQILSTRTENQSGRPIYGPKKHYYVTSNIFCCAACDIRQAI